MYKSATAHTKPVAPRERDIEYVKLHRDAPIVSDRELHGWRLDATAQMAGTHDAVGMALREDEIHALLAMQHLLSHVEPRGVLAPHVVPMRRLLTQMLDKGLRRSGSALSGTCSRSSPALPSDNAAMLRLPDRIGSVMTKVMCHALSDVLDRLESLLEGESVTVQEILDSLGGRSFASLLLIFPLISASPASAIPGVTAIVAAIVFILVGQMMLGRECVWLPAFIRRRRISSEKLCKAIGWLRKPVGFVERYLKARLTFILHRPWLYLPLGLILVLTLVMPFMEFVPTSGSIASAIIALFAAGLLTRDGVVVFLSLLLLLVLPVLFWQAASSF